MSSGVRVPVEANPSNVLRSLEAIRAAMRELGMEGQSLASVDLTKMGAADLARDLDRVRANLRDLVQINRSETARALRSVVGREPDVDSLMGLEQTAQRLYADPRARARFINNVGSYAFQGTQFGPPPAPPPDPSPPDPDNSNKPVGPRFLDSLKSGLMTGLGFVLAQAGLSSVTGAASAAIQAGQADNAAADRLLRRTNDLGMSFEQLKREAGYFHESLMTTRIDFERYAGLYASQAGDAGAVSAIKGTRLAVGSAMAYGADPSAFAGRFGNAAFMGVAPDKFAEMIALAAQRGGMTGRIEDVVGSLSHFLESASRVSATGAALTGSLQGFAGLYSSMNASGSPALRGANAVGAIDAINASITQGGGGGLAGQVLVMRALQRAGIADPYDAQMQLAGGAFAALPNGESNFEAIKDQLKGQYGSGNRAALAAGMLFGINPQTAKALLGASGRGINMAGLDQYLAPYGGISGINPTALPDILRVAGLNPKSEQEFDSLRSMANKVRGNTHLSADNAYAIDNAKTGAELRNAVVGALAQVGMTQTDQTRMLEADTKLTDALTSVGNALVNAMTALKGPLGDLVDSARPIAEWASRQVSPGEVSNLPDDALAKVTGGRKFGWKTGSVNQAIAASPQDIGPTNSLLARIGQQESRLGVASSNVYGLMSGEWVSSVRDLAQQDPEVAKMISGMSDAEILKLRSLQNAGLQEKVAAYHLAQVRHTLPASASDMAVYANWAFGNGAGPGVMKAGDNENLGAVLRAHGWGDREMGANSEYGHMTVGQWKMARQGMFPSSHAIAIKPGTLRVIVQDAKGKVHSEHRHALEGSWGDPTPAGAAPAY